MESFDADTAVKLFFTLNFLESHQILFDSQMKILGFIGTEFFKDNISIFMRIFKYWDRDCNSVIAIALNGLFCANVLLRNYSLTLLLLIYNRQHYEMIYGDRDTSSSHPMLYRPEHVKFVILRLIWHYFSFLCGHPNRPYYWSCPSVCQSVHFCAKLKTEMQN